LRWHAKTLFEIQAEADCLRKDGEKEIDCWFLTVENVSNTSPKKTILNQWVLELAIKQLLTFGPVVERSNGFVQSDGGNGGQEIRLINLLDKQDKTSSPDGTYRTFWLDMCYTGKKSDDVANGIHGSMMRFGNPMLKPFSGTTVDSGAGTPELMATSLDKVDLWDEDVMEDSCGLHDLQSVIRLPITRRVSGKARSRVAMLCNFSTHCARSSLFCGRRRVDGRKV
jgi:hypothetical protein